MTATFELALVTGASSGIGEAYARKLAARGTRLVIVARRADRLHALAAELAVDVEVHVADLSTVDGVDAVAARLGVGDVDLLVNNAGFGTADAVVTAEPGRLADEVALNVLALTRLTRAALSPMVAAGRGTIVNVGSITSFLPVPLVATYAASKAFVLSYSEALAEEVRRSGVEVQVLCPGFTRTEFQDTSGYTNAAAPSFLWMSAEQVVDASVAALGSGRIVVVPGWHNRVAAVAARHLPHWLTLPVLAFVQRKRG